MKRFFLTCTVTVASMGCGGFSFDNANTLGLADFPPELTKSVPLEVAGPYKYEPERIVGRIVYLRQGPDGQCPTAVSQSSQLVIGTKVILPAGQKPITKEPATEPLVDGKLVVKATQSGSFGPVTQSLTGEGVYTIRVIEIRYSLSPDVPTAALEAEALLPLPAGICRRFWTEYAQVIHGGSTKYTKIEGKAAGAAAAFQVEGSAFAESTNVQNRYIVNLGLRELLSSAEGLVEPKTHDGVKFQLVETPKDFTGLVEIDDVPPKTPPEPAPTPAPPPSDS